jgi:hypothetical protein
VFVFREEASVPVVTLSGLLLLRMGRVVEVSVGAVSCNGTSQHIIGIKMSACLSSVDQTTLTRDAVCSRCPQFQAFLHWTNETRDFPQQEASRHDVLPGQQLASPT